MSFTNAIGKICRRSVVAIPDDVRSSAYSPMCVQEGLGGGGGVNKTEFRQIYAVFITDLAQRGQEIAKREQVSICPHLHDLCPPRLLFPPSCSFFLSHITSMHVDLEAGGKQKCQMSTGVHVYIRAHTHYIRTKIRIQKPKPNWKRKE